MLKNEISMEDIYFSILEMLGESLYNKWDEKGKRKILDFISNDIFPPVMQNQIQEKEFAEIKKTILYSIEHGLYNPHCLIYDLTGNLENKLIKFCLYSFCKKMEIDYTVITDDTFNSLKIKDGIFYIFEINSEFLANNFKTIKDISEQVNAGCFLINCFNEKDVFLQNLSLIKNGVHLPFIAYLRNKDHLTQSILDKLIFPTMSLKISEFEINKISMMEEASKKVLK